MRKRGVATSLCRPAWGALHTKSSASSRRRLASMTCLGNIRRWFIQPESSTFSCTPNVSRHDLLRSPQRHGGGSRESRLARATCFFIATITRNPAAYQLGSECKRHSSSVSPSALAVGFISSWGGPVAGLSFSWNLASAANVWCRGNLDWGVPLIVSEWSPVYPVSYTATRYLGFAILALGTLAVVDVLEPLQLER